MKTGLKLSNYLNSHVEVKNQESQVGTDDLMQNVQREISDLHKEIDAFKEMVKDFIRQG
jgi:hypothetical protein